MKRFALLTVLLLVLATLGFADDVLKPGLAITGSATLSWGIDLDNMTTGFFNENDVSVDLTLTTAFTQSKAGAGAVYGKISVEGLDLALNLDPTDPSASTGVGWTFLDDYAVTAAIVAGALEIGVFDAPAMETTKAAVVEADETDTDPLYGEIMVVDNEPAAASYSIGGFGTYVQYTAGPVVAKLVVKSFDQWGANLNNDYAFGAEATATFAPVTFGVGAYYGLWAGADVPLIWVTAAFKQGMFDVAAAFDIDFATTVAWDASLKATLTLKEATTLGLAAYIDSLDNFDLKASFVEPAAEGFVPGLGFSVDAYILDLMTSMEYLVNASVSYAVGKFTPKVGVNVGDNLADYNDPLAALPDDAIVDNFFNVTVGVSTSMFDNVVLDLTWTSGDFLTPDSAFYAGELGQIVASAKVSL